MLITAKTLIYKSLEFYKKNFLLCLKYIFLSLVPTILGVGIGAFLSASLLLLPGASVFLIIGFFVVMLFVVVLGVWFNAAFVKNISNAYKTNTAISLRESLKSSWQHILRIVGSSLVVGFYTMAPLILSIAGWSIAQFVFSRLNWSGGSGIASAINILFGLAGMYGIFHAIYFVVRLIFAYNGVILDNKKIMESVRYSKDLTKDKWLAVFWRFLLPVLLIILFMIITNIFFASLNKLNWFVSIVSFVLVWLAELLVVAFGTIYNVIFYEEIKNDVNNAINSGDSNESNSISVN